MINCVDQNSDVVQILAVDDAPENLRLMAEILKNNGYKVRAVTNGTLALKAVTARAPDLILLDVMMPDMDGYEVCRRLKADKENGEIPVIFVSALGDIDDKIKGFEAGGVDYIGKPFEPKEVLARVETHLMRRSLQVKMEGVVKKRNFELRKINEELQQEIAERKRAEEERMRLVTAFEQTAEGIIVTSTDWVINYVNPAFESITGYSQSEILGQHTRILKSDRHDKAFYKEIRDAICHGEVWSGRLTNKRKDGTLYEAEVTGSSVLDESGTIINYVAIHRDITHEVRLEGELRQAQKMEAIGTLAGGVAHDFNNILTAIIGYAQLTYLRVPKGSPEQNFLDQMLKASSRAKDLVKQILTFSHQAELELKPMHVVPIVKEALKLLRSSLPSTIEIKQNIEIDAEGDVVLCDLTQIHQVLMNLCANAAHAMGDKAGTLRVNLSGFEADASSASRHLDLRQGNYLKLTVSDTGGGMDAATMERIFEPYFSTKGLGDGTGLGLSVVQGITKSHGGVISVYSELGRGTTFNIFLPVIKAVAATETVTTEPLLTGNERILFIDDEKALVDLGKEILGSLGYKVVTRTSSIKALEIFRVQPDTFDLVVTDLTMPGMTGIELARELLNIRSDIPIILCTGLRVPIDETELKEAGIHEIVMKPYPVSSFSRTIRKVLGKT